MNRSVLAVVFLIVLVGAAGVDARTWYIKADGTGDAPSIRAGVDSAVAGDTVLVGPGRYDSRHHANVDVRTGVAVVSERGPAETIIEPFGYDYPVTFFDCHGNNVISGFRLKGPTLYTSIGVSGDDVTISNNIIDVRNIGFGIDVQEACTIHNNLIFGFQNPAHGRAIWYTTLDAMGSTVYNNIILNRENCEYGEYVYNSWCNIVLGPACVLGYFQADPQFCGAWGEENFFLQSDSPCAPGNPENQWCGQIGPLPVGCGAVPVESRSWGAIKHMYKE